jgi:hypothetical protein
VLRANRSLISGYRSFSSAIYSRAKCRNTIWNFRIAGEKG